MHIGFADEPSDEETLAVKEKEEEEISSHVSENGIDSTDTRDQILEDGNRDLDLAPTEVEHSATVSPDYQQKAARVRKIHIGIFEDHHEDNGMASVKSGKEYSNESYAQEVSQRPQINQDSNKDGEEAEIDEADNLAVTLNILEIRASI